MKLYIPMVMKNEDLISSNFSIAKVISILVVATGHFFEESNLWVFSTIGLFVFGFSSGYFTSLKYSGRFDAKQFWKNKLSRLGVNLIVLNLFLLCLFLVNEKPGIWSWQSIVNVLGFTGVLNWLSLENPSPFGRGLWFFTLLLLFYFFYPFLSRTSVLKKGSVFMDVSLVIIFFFLNYFFNVGHSLWSTMLAFYFGCRMVEFNRIPSTWVCGLLGGILVVGGGTLNYYFQIKGLNFFFILALSLLTVTLILGSVWIRQFLFPVNLLSGCILEIYFIHPYLTVHFGGHTMVNFLSSMGLAVGIAYGLHYISEILKNWKMAKSVQFSE